MLLSYILAHLSIYYDSSITEVLPGNHPSQQPSALFLGAWITELA